tara:strand:- start:15721 stop:16041 length:321 start_codon:yes stop_codon:yes gene_type:complete
MAHKNVGEIIKDQNARIEALIHERSSYIKTAHANYKMLKDVADTAVGLYNVKLEESGRYKEALEKYADKSNWFETDGTNFKCTFDDYKMPLIGWHYAQQALKGDNK